MSAIVHDSGMPGFLAPRPQFSFDGRPEIHAPAPESYAEARAMTQKWERMLGEAWYRENANLAHQFWMMKRPWWLT